MQKEEERLIQEIAEMSAEAEKIDQAEDKLYGKNKRGEELPKALRGRENRLAAIRKTKKEIEKRAARERKKKDKDNDDNQPPKPQGKDQYNFTDPESLIMPTTKRREPFCFRRLLPLVLRAEVTFLAAQKVTQPMKSVDKQIWHSF